MSISVQYKNKKAYFNYEFVDKFKAGVVLTGTEIKSIRAGKVNFTDAYCHFVHGELWMKGLHISEYKQGSYNNHEPKRERKLLLNRKELNKLEGNIKEKGLTIIPIRLFINEKGFAKIEIALARGKAKYDKRETLKKKDAVREMDRMMKNN